MAIIRYPDSREELHRCVLFGMIIPVLVHLKFSACSSTNKVMFIFNIIVLVYHRLSIYLTDCFTDIDTSSELRTVQDPVFPNVKNHYARFRIRWNGDDSGDIKHDSELNNI